MTSADTVPATEGRARSFTIRAVCGGVLMGLANLVPGISGGTMLLATGVYAQFVGAIAELTTLKFRPRSILLLAIVGFAALAAIGSLAGVVKGLVETQRWVMYSLFIGLTLGGVPVVWRMARRVTRSLAFGFVLGCGAMIAMVGLKVGGSAESGFAILLIAGVCGAGAMILPGISGAYLLLALGQYETILGAIDAVKRGAFRASIDVLLPVGIGVVAGIVVVSNGIRWMLRRHEMLTLGILLGLLVGSVVGIYPFQQPANPAEPKSRDLVTFAPTVAQIAASLALIATGFVLTTLVDRFGNTRQVR